MTDPDQAERLRPLLREGIDWVVRMGSGSTTQEDRTALMRWRALSADHDAAWREASALGLTLRGVGREVLDERRAPGVVMPFRSRAMVHRRALIGGAIAASAIAAVGVGRSHHLVGGRAPDFVTGTGERRQVTLAPGLALDLDAQTRVVVDHHAGGHRVELLAGRAMVLAHLGRAGAVQLVAGRGQVKARDARFDVRLDGDQSCVTCLEGDLQVDYAGSAVPLRARQQLLYSDAGVGRPGMVDLAEVVAWRNGQMVFHQAPLVDVIREVNRYRPGKVVIANAAVGRRLINGIFHIADVDAAIIQVQQITGAHATRLPGGIVVLS